MSLITTVAARIKLSVALLALAALMTVSYVNAGSHGLASSADRGRARTAAESSTGDAPILLTSALAVMTSRGSTVAVFNAINAARRQAHVAPLRLVTGLYLSALTHNVTMARANVLSHQLVREPAFGSRITAQRVQWVSAGENIGWTSVMTIAGAVGIENAMMAERAPSDGHRRNILSPSFTGVGVNVVIDKIHHRLWLTEDFVRS